MKFFKFTSIFVSIFTFFVDASVSNDDVQKNESTVTVTDEEEDFEAAFKYNLTDSVNVQIIDKISGTVVIKKIGVNKPFAFKRIRVIVRKCFVSPVDKPLNYIGFVEIYHVPYSKNIEKIFSNWMFTENITINMFEHPVYDVRLIK